LAQLSFLQSLQCLHTEYPSDFLQQGQPAVNAHFHFNQILMAAPLHNPPILHQQYFIGFNNGAQAVGY
jgi:hypothetical protein